MDKKLVLRELVVAMCKEAYFMYCAMQDYSLVSHDKVSNRMVTKPDASNISKMLSGLVIPRATTFIDWINACGCHIEIVPDKPIEPVRSINSDKIIHRFNR